jgi:hypothetical protein
MQGIKMTETSMATIPGVNLGDSQLSLLKTAASSFTYHRGGTKYLLTLARPEEKYGEYRANSHIGDPRSLEESAIIAHSIQCRFLTLQCS